MTIKEEQLNQLSRIYNTLFEIQTKGESTLIITDCIRALEQTITSIQNNTQEEKE